MDRICGGRIGEHGPREVLVYGLLPDVVLLLLGEHPLETTAGLLGLPRRTRSCCALVKLAQHVCTVWADLTQLADTAVRQP